MQKAEGMHIDLSWFQYLARVKSRLGSCYKAIAQSVPVKPIASLVTSR